ncbi:unnamed protein product [Toxocara canis]|uniref:Phosphopyruvate hydratase n=1 Tax=Toxocara canis TaxID=6265 RepID=A0A183UBC6_TOXCA|nr:unnamed protein product [Toxocara canis]
MVLINQCALPAAAGGGGGRGGAAAVARRCLRAAAGRSTHALMFGYPFVQEMMHGNVVQVEDRKLSRDTSFYQHQQVAIKLSESDEMGAQNDMVVWCPPKFTIRA